MWIVLIQRPSGIIETVGPFKDEFAATRWAADAVDADCDYEVHNVSTGKAWSARNPAETKTKRSYRRGVRNKQTEEANGE